MTVYYPSVTPAVLSSVASGSVVNKTANYTLLLSENNGHVAMSSSSTKVFTLPVVTAADVGVTYTLYKFGVGGLMIFAQAGNTVTLGQDQESAAGGGVMNTSTQLFARVRIKLVTATRWMTSDYVGTWNIASSLLGGLVSYWNLEEASGTRFDSHTGGYNLTDVNTVAQTAGKIGFGALFVRVNEEKLTIQNSAFNLGPSATDFTIAAWVKKTDLTVDYNYFLNFNNAGTSTIAYSLAVGSTPGSNISFGLNNVATVTSSFAFQAADITNQTYHLAIATYQNSNLAMNLYIDNGVANSGTANAPLISFPSGTLTIGHGNTFNPGQNINGGVDEVGIWNRLLTTQERIDLYNSGAGITYPFSS